MPCQGCGLSFSECVEGEQSGGWVGNEGSFSLTNTVTQLPIKWVTSYIMHAQLYLYKCPPSKPMRLCHRYSCCITVLCESTGSVNKQLISAPLPPSSSHSYLSWAPWFQEKSLREMESDFQGCCLQKKRSNLFLTRTAVEKLSSVADREQITFLVCPQAWSKLTRHSCANFIWTCYKRTRLNTCAEWEEGGKYIRDHLEVNCACTARTRAGNIFLRELTRKTRCTLHLHRGKQFTKRKYGALL